MTIGIYKITNKKTDQIYIGQSINIEKRFKEHVYGKGCPSSYIDNAIQKYGKDCFNFEIIEKFDKNTPFLDDVLNDSEQYYIAAYNTFEDDFHYNLTIGGDSLGSGKNHPRYGKHHSEKTKKKMSKAKKRKYIGKNHPMYGKHHSEETKKKIGKAHSGKKVSEETKKKMSKGHYGKKRPEHSKRMSGKNNPMYNKKHSEETKKKISESNSGKNNSMWKNYARIVKAGKYNNKQRYAIIYQGKIIKVSISINKLYKWFFKNHPLEIIKTYEGGV